jgi:co-chaperonin GroES (HSP10)
MTSQQTINASGLKAVGKAVLCKPYHPEFDRTMLAIPDHVKAMELMGEMRAVVIQVGAWAWSGEPEARAKPGDKVLIQKYCGAIVKGTKDGEFYRLCNDQDIFCQIESGEMDELVPKDPIAETKRVQRETERVAQLRR